jgi:hypothetical protein
MASVRHSDLSRYKEGDTFSVLMDFNIVPFRAYADATGSWCVALGVVTPPMTWRPATLSLKLGTAVFLVPDASPILVGDLDVLEMLLNAGLVLRTVHCTYVQLDYIDKATQVINFNKGQIVPQSVIDKAIDSGRCYVQRSLRYWPDGKDLCFEQTKSETQVEIKFYWKDQEQE